MAFLGALSAAGRGYIDQLPQTYEMMGMEALGKAFSMPQGSIDRMAMGPGSGPGPQPPMPGQPSVPMQHPLGPMAQEPMPGQPSPPMEGGMPLGGAPNAPVQGGSAMGGPPTLPFMTGQPGPFPQPTAPSPPMQGGQPQGGLPQFDLQTIIGKIQQANPGLPPQAMAAALRQAVPLLNADGKLQLAKMGIEMRRDMEMGRNARFQQGEERKTEQGNRRLDTGEERTDILRGESERKTTQGNQRIEQGERRLGQGERRLDQAAQRENRLLDRQIFSQDQAYKNFELKKQEIERKIQSGDRSADLAQLRAVIAAQHNRATEIINANATNMTKAQKNAIEAEANKVRDESLKAIQGMRKPAAEAEPKGSMVGQPGETIIGGGVSATVPAPLPPQALQQLKEGHVTTFANGQKWTIENGQPKQVQ